MTIHELRLRSNKFVDNLQSYIEGAIDDNTELLDLNREQLKVEHATINDQKIIPQYSKAYAKQKGFKTPDLFVTGELFKSLTIETKGSTFEINGNTDYTPKLIEWYSPDIFGIAKSKRPRAKQITTKQLSEDYQKAVLNR
jgi:hypothetical protein